MCVLNDNVVPIFELYVGGGDVEFLIRFGRLDDARVELSFPVAGFMSITGKCMRNVRIVGKLVDFGSSGNLHGGTDGGCVVGAFSALPGASAWSDVLMRRAFV